MCVFLCVCVVCCVIFRCILFFFFFLFFSFHLQQPTDGGRSKPARLGSQIFMQPPLHHHHHHHEPVVIKIPKPHHSPLRDWIKGTRLLCSKCNHLPCIHAGDQTSLTFLLTFTHRGNYFYFFVLSLSLSLSLSLWIIDLVLLFQSQVRERTSSWRTITFITAIIFITTLLCAFSLFTVLPCLIMFKQHCTGLWQRREPSCVSLTSWMAASEWHHPLERHEKKKKKRIACVLAWIVFQMSFLICMQMCSETKHALPFFVLKPPERSEFSSPGWIIHCKPKIPLRADALLNRSVTVTGVGWWCFWIEPVVRLLTQSRAANYRDNVSVMKWSPVRRNCSARCTVRSDF